MEERTGGSGDEAGGVTALVTCRELAGVLVRLGAERDWMPSVIGLECSGARSKSCAGRAHLAACSPPDGYVVSSLSRSSTVPHSGQRHISN